MTISSNRAFSLVELLIALLVFSILIGFTSNFLVSGLKTVRSTDDIEKNLNFMEDLSLHFHKVSNKSPWLKIGVHDNPDIEVDLPDSIKSWQITWSESNQPGLLKGMILLELKGGKKIEWQIYKDISSD